MCRLSSGVEIIENKISEQHEIQLGAGVSGSYTNILPGLIRKYN